VFYIGDYTNPSSLPTNKTKNCVNEYVNIGVNIINGDPPFSYLWQLGGQTSSTISVSPGSTTTYIVTTEDECGFIWNDTVTVTVVNHPALSVSGNQNITLPCPGDQVTLQVNVSGGSGNTLPLIWSDGVNNYPNGTTVTPPNGTTTYTVQIQDTCAGMNTTYSFTVTVPTYPPLIVSTLNDTMICPSLQFPVWANATGGAGGYSYAWNNGTNGANTYIVDPQNGTVVSVVVTDQCGTTATASFTITISPIIADFDILTPMPAKPKAEVLVENKSQYDVSWLWTSNGNTYNIETPIFTYPEPAVYTICLRAYNSDGCYNEICKEVTIEDDFIIPNIFTPNGDASNDLFVIKGLYGSGNSLLVYNRWGKKIYENADYKNDWDGSANGKPLSDGTYFYIMIRSNGEEHTGSITILR
jgi:gliding motility-associated-like protein